MEKSDTKNIGLWNLYEDDIIYKTIMSCNAEMDILEIIQDVNEFIQLHLGKLESLEKLSKNLKMSINHLYRSQQTEKTIYEKIRNEKNEEINLMVIMKKVDNQSDCLCNMFSIVEAFKCSVIKIRVTLSRPSKSNCSRFM